jgi:hypothetical protein
MWEDANPDFTTTLNVAGNCLAGGLDLAAVDAFIIKAHKAIIAKCYSVAAASGAFVFAFADLAVRFFTWLSKCHNLFLPLIDPNFNTYDTSDGLSVLDIEVDVSAKSM